MSATSFSNFVFFCSKSLRTLTKSCPGLYLICLKILLRAYNFIIKSITASLIIFKKPRKMAKDFFNHYVFVRTFQWTSSECLTNVTITVKVAMITYTKFFSIRVFFTDTDNSQDSRGREGSIFYSTLPLPPAHKQ